MSNKFWVFVAIATALTAIDWILGMLIVRELLPAWVMIVFNLPFGVVYTWTEAQWAGGNYVVDGSIVPEDTIMATQFFALAAQVLVYFGVWIVWQWRRERQMAN